MSEEREDQANFLRGETIDLVEEKYTSDKPISVSHGLLCSMIESLGADIIYNGGEVKIDYYVSASGMASTGVGFLVFLNGKAQPYYVINDESEKTTEKAYEYMHVFYPKDNERETFQFCFVPITGKVSDILDVCIASVYNPGYCPDVFDHHGYGRFHDMIEGIYSMKFEKNPPETNIVKNDSQIINFGLSKEIVSEENKEILMGNDFLSEEMSHNISCGFWIDGENMKYKNSYNINEKNVIHLCLEIFGFPEAEYGVTIFINNNPLFLGENSSWTFVQENNMVTKIEADIDVSKIDKKGTVYVVLAPVNGIDMRTDMYTLWLQKTKSILLWKE